MVARGGEDIVAHGGGVNDYLDGRQQKCSEIEQTEFQFNFTVQLLEKELSYEFPHSTNFSPDGKMPE